MQEGSTAADLIDRAFGLARRSGKTDWWAMTIPVLKNRLLQLTKNDFKEADFGATSFREFLGKFPNIVRVDDTHPPGLVILKSAIPDHSERLSPHVFRGQRIRSDLWRSVLDYSSGRKYVWDASLQAARAAGPDENGLELPTISVADLDEWRTEFVTLHLPSDAEIAKRVDEWRKNRLPTAGLPAAMVPVWNKYLIGKIEHRLQNWFSNNSIEMPPILERQESLPSDTQVEELREFVIGCVKTMSKRELLELRISPITALRTLRPNISGDKNGR